MACIMLYVVAEPLPISSEFAAVVPPPDALAVPVSIAEANANAMTPERMRVTVLNALPFVGREASSVVE